MFTKHEFKLEMLSALCSSNSKSCISIVRSPVQIADLSVVKFWVLAVPYKSSSSFAEIFPGLKARLIRHKLRK